jgi:phosphoribosyl 1,2-cyclic phosphodiesterase
MAFQFAALASGSSGNAAHVRAGGSGLLIDLGVGARTLAARLGQVGAAWSDLSAAILTHTHGDHVGESALVALTRHRIPLFCHEGHRSGLARFEAFAALEASGLVRAYDERPFLAPGGFRIEPIPLSHDGGPTFGFRVEAREVGRGRTIALGYVADTGCWTDAIADGLAEVDLLGVEFNHDVGLQRASGRSWHLIRRNLGDGGHLSNDQGASLLAEVLRRSPGRAPRNVVLLHLSRQCNRPELALSVARTAVRGTGRRIRFHIAPQEGWGTALDIEASPRGLRRAASAAGFPWEVE